MAVEQQYDQQLTIGQCAALACLMEATAPKPGNVYRGADFDDLTYFDLVASGSLIAPVMDAAPSRPLGETIFQAVEKTRRYVQTNANLGIVLLFAPIAAVPRDRDLESGIQQVLDGLTPEDCRKTYQAIRLAGPGGMGTVDQADLAGDPPDDLITAMHLAAERDQIAKQYVTGFADVLEAVVPWLLHGVRMGFSLADAIVRAHLRLLHELPDSLIARKCGLPIAQQVAVRAGATLAAGEPGEPEYDQALADFDFWLRADHHRRNPGTTADLIAAGLFAALREDLIAGPWKFYD